MLNPFGILPERAVSVKPFTISVPDEELSALRSLLEKSKVAAPSFENSQEDRRYGVSRDWMLHAKGHWLNKFDWRACEKRINSFPNFMARIENEHEVYDVHFTALFSKMTNATPVISVHGWPGSFLEYLPLMSLVSEEYAPESLPYHLIVPSIPGFTFSSGPPVGRSIETPTVAQILDKLMANLGFAHGYVATGGDIGSSIARILASKNFDSRCRGALINFCAMRNPPAYIADSALSEQDYQFIERGKRFLATGYAYAMEHGTRTSTIGLVLGSNPLALLAWMGEKYLEWSDNDPSLDTILEAVSLYWFTNTIARCLYTYRQYYEGKASSHDSPQYYIDKPFGYLLFPKEIMPVPKAWAETTGDLSFFRQHDAGGHFAALECPAESKRDMEEFLQHMIERGVTFTAQSLVKND